MTRASGRAFTIEPRGDGHVRLEQRERFRGLLVPLLARSLDRHTLPAFELMNQALKRRAERRSGTRAGPGPCSPSPTA
jgi:hypothetical protein